MNKLYLKPQINEDELVNLSFEMSRTFIGTDIKLQQDRKLFSYGYIQGYKYRDEEIEELRKLIQLNNLEHEIELNKYKQMIEELQNKLCKCDIQKEIIIDDNKTTITSDHKEVDITIEVVTETTKQSIIDSLNEITDTTIQEENLNKIIKIESETSDKKKTTKKVAKNKKTLEK